MDYKTSNFGLAVFLLCKGITLRTMEQIDRNKKAFVFFGTYSYDGNEELTTSDIADQYLWGKLRDNENPDLKVNVKDYEAARNRLLDLMNEH